MPANIEIKARLKDVQAAHAVATRLSGGPPHTLRQTDVFFDCPDGRLKLRILDDNHGELILYHRADGSRIRRSDYVIAPTTSPNSLLEILRRTLKARGTVKKIRSLYLVGQTRIHIDQVEGLGDFLELEVVLSPGQSEAEATQIASDLLKQFGISEGDFEAQAYIDLLHS